MRIMKEYSTTIYLEDTDVDNWNSMAKLTAAEIEKQFDWASAGKTFGGSGFIFRDGAYGSIRFVVPEDKNAKPQLHGELYAKDHRLLIVSSHVEGDTINGDYCFESKSEGVRYFVYIKKESEYDTEAAHLSEKEG